MPFGISLAPEVFQRRLLELIEGLHGTEIFVVELKEKLTSVEVKSLELVDQTENLSVRFSFSVPTNRVRLQPEILSVLIFDTPFSKVGPMMFTNAMLPCTLFSRFHLSRILLVFSDHFNYFIYVDSLASESSTSVIRSLMAICSRFGVPNTLVTDNESRFASSQFAKFADFWNFQYFTSRPRYPHSNGKAENAVRTVERLFTKCRAAGFSEFQTLLDWPNTPKNGMDTSPAQRLLGRR